MTKYYLIHVINGIEPEAKGPYSSEEDRDRAALIIHNGGREQEGHLRREFDPDTDGIYWANVWPDGTLQTGSYSAGYFMEDE